MLKKDNKLAIYSIYYDDDRKIVGCSEQPAIVTGEDVEEIKPELQLMIDATEEEVIDLDQISFQNSLD